MKDVMNNVVTSNELGSVVMPLVDLLTSSGLSWSQRQAIACAIRETTRHHNSMENERQKDLMLQAGGQRASGQIVGAGMAPIGGLASVQGSRL